jgi:DNA-binding transcriptional LysR family regulator
LTSSCFTASRRGVELTEAGRALFAEARAVLAHLEHALETTHRTARGEQGRLCISIAPTALFHPLVSRAIRDFREAFPLVSLTLEEGPSHEVVEPLRNDRMDVAFVRNAAIHVEGIVGNTPEEAAALFKTESARWGKGHSRGCHSRTMKVLARDLALHPDRRACLATFYCLEWRDTRSRGDSRRVQFSIWLGPSNVPRQGGRIYLRNSRRMTRRRVPARPTS